MSQKMRISLFQDFRKPCRRSASVTEPYTRPETRATPQLQPTIEFYAQLAHFQRSRPSLSQPTHWPYSLFLNHIFFEKK